MHTHTYIHTYAHVHARVRAWDGTSQRAQREGPPITRRHPSIKPYVQLPPQAPNTTRPLDRSSQPPTTHTNTNTQQTPPKQKHSTHRGRQRCRRPAPPPRGHQGTRRGGPRDRRNPRRSSGALFVFLLIGWLVSLGFVCGGGKWKAVVNDLVRACTMRGVVS
jgi:hypothetical protein